MPVSQNTQPGSRRSASRAGRRWRRGADGGEGRSRDIDGVRDCDALPPAGVHGSAQRMRALCWPRARRRGPVFCRRTARWPVDGHVDIRMARTLRSASTSTRPARSIGTPSVRANGDAATPAAHNTVRAGTRSLPSNTPSPSIEATASGAHLDARRSSCARALADNGSGTSTGFAVPLRAAAPRAARIDAANSARRVWRRSRPACRRVHAGGPPPTRRRSTRPGAIRIGVRLCTFDR